MINTTESIDMATAAPARPGSPQPANAHTAPAGPAPTLRWVGSSILRGCNVHHDRTVLRVVVDFGALHGRTSASAGPAFAGRFIARFRDPAQTPPTAPDDACFFDALRTNRGVPFEEVVLQAILAVERRLAFARNDFVPIAMASVEPIDPAQRARQARLVWECRHPEQSRSAARLALAGVLGLLPAPLRAGHADDVPDFDAALAALMQRAGRRRTSSATSLIALAAHVRGIPFESMGGPHLQLGHGAAQHMVYSSVPAGARLAATLLSRNKRKTTRRLAQLGLPATRQIAVASVQQALAAAATLGYPVVVKPQNGKQGGGVSVGVTSDEELAAAFERASRADSRVLVETFVRGTACRLLVIGGRFVAAAEIAVPSVIGDGTHRIDELIEAMNRDPMRNGVRLCKIVVDDDLHACLARGGHRLADVLPAGREIALRTAANISVGGAATDVTDRVHASHRELAERAAAAIGLSVAGIDVVSPDISRPCAEVGTRVIEVNARPGLDMHAFPRHGRPRDVAGAMVELTFPPGATGRLPTALVLGRRGTRAVARELDAQLRERGHTTGVITRDAALIAGEPPAPGHPPLHETLAVAQRDPRVQALVVAMTPRRAVARGLALESADAVALLAGDAQGVASDDARALTLALRVARGAIVVEADNDAALALLREMMLTGTLERERLILVSTRLRDPAVDAHVEAGGAAVVSLTGPHGGRIVVRRRDGTVPVQGRAAAPGAAWPGDRATRACLIAAALACALDSSARRPARAVARSNRHGS
jgi:cyanophycin synthetase